MAAQAKILVIDDEPHVRAFVSALLRSTFAEIEVLLAADEPAAVAAMAKRPDLVLLDINLVGLSGLDLLPRLLALHPDAVVVMLTAVNVRHAIEEAKARGAAGYILKDGPPDELSAAIVEVVRSNFEVSEPESERP